MALIINIIRGWLERANRHGFKQNEIWFLVSMTWWRNWLEFVGASVSNTLIAYISESIYISHVYFSVM